MKMAVECGSLICRLCSDRGQCPTQ